ncbi:Protein transport protein Sec23A [Lucilia cuprina]|nr:Protein transport protein Sec23A [Lucilia cuprina]
MLGIGRPAGGPQGGQLGPGVSQWPGQHKRICLVPRVHCPGDLLSELQRDRLGQCLRASVISVQNGCCLSPLPWVLLECTYPNTGARIMLLLAEPCSQGPG